MVDKAKAYVTDITNPYILNDVDADTATKYYGYSRPDGSWYIQRETESGGDQLYRYVKGSVDYATAWTSRASLSYDYGHEIFA